MSLPLSDEWSDFELNICNPSSKISSFMLRMFSFRFRELSVREHLIRVTKQQDYQQVKTFGPIVKIMNEILYVCEKFKNESERIKTGFEIMKQSEGN